MLRPTDQEGGILTALQQWARIASRLFNGSREGIVVTDARQRILLVNDAFQAITGYESDEVVGHTPSLLASGKHGATFYEEMWRCLQADDRWEGEVWNRRKNGEVYAEYLTVLTVRDDEGIISHYVGSFSDISRMKEQESRLQRITNEDLLTGLPTRQVLVEHLVRERFRMQLVGGWVGLIQLDLDDFRYVNDTYGHETGDRVLVEVAERCSALLRGRDLVSRVSGDEFVIVLSELESEDEVEHLLVRMLAALEEPMEIGPHVIRTTASAGVVVVADYEDDPAPLDEDSLIRMTSQAMFRAKERGRNRFEVMDVQRTRKVREEREKLERFEMALHAGELLLHYQPKVSMRTGEVEGVEALLRWQHPERGLLWPGAFLRDIQNSHLDLPLGGWVLGEAMRQAAAWKSEGTGIPISVNISALQLQNPGFVEQLVLMLEQHPGLVARDLELEVLESSVLEDLDQVQETILACRDAGFLVTLDDFGTGYSSLTWLRRLPVSRIKVDQSFVRQMMDSKEDFAIVRSVIQLAHTFERQVIAEGVETVEQGIALMNMGYDLAQGFGIARPMPADEVQRWVRSWSPPSEWQRTGRTRARRASNPSIESAMLQAAEETSG